MRFGSLVVPPTQLEKYGSVTLREDNRVLHSVDDRGVVHLVDLVRGRTLIEQSGLPGELTFGPRPVEVLLHGDLVTRLARVEGDRFVPIATRARHLSSGGWQLFGGRGVVLREDGTALLGASPTRTGVRFVSVDFRDPGAPPAPGAPRELLERWSQQLGLEVDERGVILDRR